MHTLDLGVFMFKSSINDLPAGFNNFFTKRSEIHKYSTRHVNDLNLAKNKKSFSDNGVRTKGPILWNSLSKRIKSSKSVKHFRNQLKRNLIQKYDVCVV